MRRILHAGAVVLVASMTYASVASAQMAADFVFTYDTDYSDQGLSQPYGGTTTTGQSYGTGVAINASDTAQMVYSLVEANPNIGVGGLRGGFPADSRTLAASSSTPGYLGPYYLVRRAADGTIDSAFGENGYVSEFGNSADSSYKFTSLCIDPGTGSMVLVGQQTTSSGPVGFVERLLPPATGSDSASLDTSFNPSGPTPGVVTIATPNGNNNPTPYGCTVVDEGAGHSGAVLVGGVDQGSGSSLILAAKISSFGGYDTLFGSNGVVEYPVDTSTGSGPSAELTNVSLSGTESDFGDLILCGFSFTTGTKDGASAQATALTVALKDRTGALDTNFNGTVQLVDPNYGEAVLARVKSSHVGDGGGTATDLDIVYGTVGSDAAEFVDYPISNGVPDLSSPVGVGSGTFTVPPDFVSMQGYTFDDCGHILISGDTSANQEMLTQIGGATVLGYRCADPNS